MNRREFVSGATAFAASTLGLPSVVSAAPAFRYAQLDGPCLPPHHPGYDLLQLLELRGLFTGFPDGTFAGKLPVSRRKFVWALRTIFAQIPYYEGAGATLFSRNSFDAVQSMRSVANELGQEFTEQGVTQAQLRAGLAHFEALWRMPLPRGVTDPVDLPPEIYRHEPLWPFDERARADGARLAREEWQRGTLCLYLAEPVGQVADNPDAIPLLAVPKAGADPYQAQVLLGHNAEMWRLLRRVGAPRGSRLAWTRDLFRLRSVWSRSGQAVVAIREKRTYLSPDGQFRFDGTSFTPTRARPYEPRPCELGGPELQRSFYRLLRPFALLWGEPGSGIAYLRSHGWRGEHNPVRLFAVDLRTQIILNAAVA